METTLIYVQGGIAEVIGEGSAIIIDWDNVEAEANGSWRDGDSPQFDDLMYCVDTLQRLGLALEGGDTKSIEIWRAVRSLSNKVLDGLLTKRIG